MTIPINEFQTRIKLIQNKMQESQLDFLVVYSWKRGQVKYLAGYHPNYVANTATILLPQSGDPILFIRFPFDLERATRKSWIKNIKASGDMNMMVTDIADGIKKFEGSIHRIGVVGGDFVMDEIPFSMMSRLQHLLPNCIFSDERNLLMEMRRVKSLTEIEKIKKSAALADQGLKTARAVISAGKTELQVVAEIEAELRRKGAENHLVVIAAPGHRKLIGPPTERIIEPQEDIIIEIAVEAGGYWSQVAAVLFSTPPNEAQKKISAMVYDAYQHITTGLRIGQTCEQVAENAIGYFDQLGYKDYIEQDFGHGIGLDLPEPPKIEIGDQTLLGDGMVIVVHPAIRVPGVGGAFIGGTVLVDNQGALQLHDLSLIMQEAK